MNPNSQFRITSWNKDGNKTSEYLFPFHEDTLSQYVTEFMFDEMLNDVHPPYLELDNLVVLASDILRDVYPYDYKIQFVDFTTEIVAQWMQDFEDGIIDTVETQDADGYKYVIELVEAE